MATAVPQLGRNSPSPPFQLVDPYVSECNHGRGRPETTAVQGLIRSHAIAATLLHARPVSRPFFVSPQFRKVLDAKD